MKLKSLLLVAAIGLAGTAAVAQNSINKWGIGVQAGYMSFSGDYSEKLYTPSGGFSAGLTLSRYLSPSFDLMAEFLFERAQADDNYQRQRDTLLQFKANIFNANLLLKYKFDNGYILKDSAKLAPYLVLGVGGMLCNTTGIGYDGPKNWQYKIFTDEKVNTVNIAGGIGLTWKASPKWNIYLQSIVLAPFSDKIDGWYQEMDPNNWNDLFLKTSLGVIYNIGKPKDTDGDGVPDKTDKCPDTPAGITVNPDGCPLDTDMDGVYDYLDKCPAVAGLAAFEGCPDTDGDGIQDSQDKCPDVKGLAALNGCPDADGDGIADAQDKCPTVKGLAAFNGCPDTDGDGIQDSEDRCPTVAGLKDLQGCPDTDGDGVADLDDKCPTVAGIKENKGCPAISAETEMALKNILFETGKDVIRPSFFPILNNIVSILNNHPEYLLDINGHTDSVDDEESNMALSQRRANSVKKYLTDKGIAASRLTTNWFGETQPTTDNKTASGRTKNRRVEFKVSF